LDLGIIGYGRVGEAFATALTSAGHRAVAICTRSPGRRAAAQDRFPHGLVDSPADVAGVADVIFITTPDDSIASIADSLSRDRALSAGQVVVHASGRHGLGVLDAVTASGAARAAVHPVMTLPGGHVGADMLKGAVFGVAADATAASRVAQLVADMGGRPVHVPDEARALYHASLVLGGNFLGTLTNAAVELLRAAGITDPATAIGPLLRASVDNALVQGERAMTGPVRRNDTETLHAHLEALRRDAPDLVDSYRALSVLTAHSLERAGVLSAAAAASVRAALREAQ
jgi:predicted short-subunit dehydrogenase-like oxidoreductase (DUF2520 family)